MRRLAIGAAVAALPALVLAAGSAGAQPASTDAGVAMTSDVLINEIGVDLDTVDGSFIELHNAGSSTVNIGDWVLSGCDTTDLFTVTTIPAGTMLPSGEFYLIADDDYDNGGGPLRNRAFDAGADLVQSDGGMLLEDSSVTEVHDVKWGNPQDLCATFIDAGVTPDDDHSIQPNPTPPPAWCRAIPTPAASNGPCVF